MKKKLLMLCALLLVSVNGFSDTGNKLVDTSEAVSAALTMFETDHGEMTNLFKGLKASPEQNGVVVKVYLTDGSNMSYSCHRHTEMDPFECHHSK